jgi:mono/diheme cytochrome c family protein
MTVVLLLPRQLAYMPGGDNSPGPDVKLVAEGRFLYTEHCARCHGDDGAGDGSEARWFTIPPSDLTSGQYKFRSTASGEPPLPEDIYRTLTEGLRGTGMLPQLQLSKEQRWAVTRYLKTLVSLQVGADSLEAVPIPEPPKVSEELIARGREAYSDLGCGKCHGADGRGRGPSAEEIRDYKDRPIKPTDLTLTPNKRSNTPEDLYRTLVTGINGTPMPAYGGILPAEQLWGLVYYVDGLAVNTMPTADIPAELGMMGMGMMGMGMMRDMPRRMGFVGEEAIAMMIDMPAARAWKMGPGMMGRGPW